MTGAGGGGVITRDPLEEPPGTTVTANPYAYVRNDPLNHTDPLGLRTDDCTFASDVCVIDDLGGAFGTTNDQVKAGAGRTKTDHGYLFGQAGCILNQNCGLMPYNVANYTDEIYFAAIHAQIDTRLVYAVIAKESEGLTSSPVFDEPPGSWADRDQQNIGPGNVSEVVFNSVVSRHSDIFGGSDWGDLTSDKTLAAKITAFRLRDLNDDLNGSIARNNVTRISRPHGCERRGESEQAAVFCRSTLLSYAYVKKFEDTVGGVIFDTIFRERKFPKIGNAEFIPSGGSLTNAVHPFMADAWNYYCGSDGHFLC